MIAQDSQADYEGELCLVIGRDTKNIFPENALSYIAAYTVGNDISARKLQRDPPLAGRVPQWGFSKGFDTFAPLGPCLVAASEIADPSKLLLKTIVGGKVRQEEYVADLDLLFDCVGAGLSPPKYLVPGTHMDVVIDASIGTLRNGVVFD
ncbi:hypothetical protein N7516_005946 [Penicillium verrucosum]|uniref:uncharacterized protein n=1 Tax=Penicillium verrucosum TaxID=60171 RepID=UPI002544FD0F|nr:uncharacterized protein N7516_005946 [Penicillium verrucosum]KAJ5931457.1 hypothetical protein N7516_005946 [Penicillium verrucosum]